MCGYFGNLHESPAVLDLFNQLGIPLPYPQGRAYPRQSLSGLVTFEEGAYQVSSALWWYQLKHNGEQFEYNEKVTSFNARDLQKPLWRDAAQYRRGLVFATELGESEGKHRYLMQSKEGFALGALYKDWQHDGQNTRSMAIITRSPHPRFAQYHSKSLPLFVPLKPNIIQAWLNPDPATEPVVQRLLQLPKITTDLCVTPVKSYKHAEPLGPSQPLKADNQEG